MSNHEIDNSYNGIEKPCRLPIDPGPKGEQDIKHTRRRSKLRPGEDGKKGKRTKRK